MKNSTMKNCYRHLDDRQAILSSTLNEQHPVISRLLLALGAAMILGSFLIFAVTYCYRRRFQSGSGDWTTLYHRSAASGITETPESTTLGNTNFQLPVTGAYTSMWLCRIFPLFKSTPHQVLCNDKVTISKIVKSLVIYSFGLRNSDMTLFMF